MTLKTLTVKLGEHFLIVNKLLFIFVAYEWLKYRVFITTLILFNLNKYFLL
jgi:hypothetical protein